MHSSVSYRYRAAVRRIVDADTVVFDVDLGFRVSAAITGRIATVDAPERYTDAGMAAAAWAEKWLTPVLRGTEVHLILESRKDARSFERWVVDVWRVVGDGEPESFADALVAASHGTRRE